MGFEPGTSRMQVSCVTTEPTPDITMHADDTAIFTMHERVFNYYYYIVELPGKKAMVVEIKLIYSTFRLLLW